MSVSRPRILALPTFVRSRKEQRKRRERTGRILEGESRQLILPSTLNWGLVCVLNTPHLMSVLSSMRLANCASSHAVVFAE